MTTTIRSFLYLQGVADHYDGAGVLVGCNDDGESHLSRHGYVSRAEFLAAVATELDVLVIPRTDLPEVDTSNGVRAGGVRWHSGEIAADLPERARRFAMEYLAVAEYLDAHPPIDQAQVDALANLIARTRKDQYVTPNDLAERLIRTGCITVKGSEA